MLVRNHLPILLFKFPFIELFEFSIFEKMTIRNTAPFVGQADLSLPSAKRQTVKTTELLMVGSCINLSFPAQFVLS